MALPSLHRVVTHDRGSIPAPRTPETPGGDELLPPESGTLEELFSHIVQIDVWTSDEKGWQENATFLLTTDDGRTVLRRFDEPDATELVTQLYNLPGFSPGLLLELLAGQNRRITSLWRRPSPAGLR